MVLTDEQRELIEKTMLQLLERKGWFTARDVYKRLEDINPRAIIGFLAYHGYRDLREEYGVKSRRIIHISKKTGRYENSIEVYHRKDVSPPDSVEY